MDAACLLGAGARGAGGAGDPERKAMAAADPALVVSLDVGGFDDRGPFRPVRFDPGGELLCFAADRLGASRPELLLRVPHLQDLVDLGVPARDDRVRRSSRGGHARPVSQPRGAA